METSLLEAKILEFLSIDLKENDDNYGSEYFMDDFLLNWNKITSDLFQGIGEFDFGYFVSNNNSFFVCFTDYQETLQNVDDCLKLKYKIEPILVRSLKIHEKKSEFSKQIRKFCGWTYQVEDIINQFEASKSHSSIQVLEDILFLTSLIENTLGNIYWSSSHKNPPNLLTDLLATQEVKNIVGRDEVKSF